MKKIESILFATDFSESSGPASEQALGFAELTGAHLHVLHVIGELEEPQRVMIPAEAFQTLQKEVEVKAVRDLETFCQGAPAGVATTTHVLIGNPFRKILEMSKELKADLIVMGTHGRTGIEHVIVGSTAERVVRHSKIPVLTVRAPA